MLNPTMIQFNSNQTKKKKRKKPNKYFSVKVHTQVAKNNKMAKKNKTKKTFAEIYTLCDFV